VQVRPGRQQERSGAAARVSGWGVWGWDTMPQTGYPAVWNNGGWWNPSCIAPAWYNMQGCNPGADADFAFTIIN
jgi:hypothetical protein